MDRRTLMPYFTNAPSPWQRRVRRMGSVQAAVALLLALAAGCAAVGIRHGRGGAGSGNALWSWGLLLLACVALFCALLSRWPWRKQDAGFLAAHGGMLCILLGGILGHGAGLEIPLRLEAPASIRENRMVFANKPPISASSGGSGALRIGLALLVEPTGEALVELRATPYRHRQIPLAQRLHKTITWPPGGRTRLHFQGYWPDFAMGPGGPFSRSPAPNRPALLVEITADPAPVFHPVAELGLAIALLRVEVPAARGGTRDVCGTVALRQRSGSAPPAWQAAEMRVSARQPAAWPAGFWRAALGRNTRLLPAQWNPENPREGTFLLRRNPGWPLQWIGSLLFCGGLTGLFLRREP